MKDLHIYYEDIDRIFRCVVMENPQFLQVSWNYSDWELAWNSDREIWEIDRLILEYGRELEDIKKTKDSFNETVKRIISGAKKKDMTLFRKSRNMKILIITRKSAIPKNIPFLTPTAVRCTKKLSARGIPCLSAILRSCWAMTAYALQATPTEFICGTR